MTHPLTTKITPLAQQACAALGLQLVAVQVLGARKMTVQVLIEQLDGASPTVEQCTQLSRLLSTQLDVADVIAGKYVLEVSSPGLDRPLFTPADFTRFAGKQARVVFTTPQPNPAAPTAAPMGSVVGLLDGADTAQVRLHVGGAVQAFPLRSIKSAALHPSAEELEAFIRSAPSLKNTAVS